VNARRTLLFANASLRGHRYPRYYREFESEYQAGLSSAATTRGLSRLLAHCRAAVPYYAALMQEIDGTSDLEQQPEQYLAKLPILTKETLRTQFDQLRSSDLKTRKWRVNKSGGSTGEPIRIIQDAEFSDRGSAIELLFSRLVGHEPGQAVVRLWGSERDLFEGTLGWKAKMANLVTNTTFLNAFRMDPERMREFIRILNQKRPRLIVAYAQAAYELAKFAADESLQAVPPQAIITSAGTLHPFMRQTIGAVFGCRVFNRYGAREVGGIACELPEGEDLWVAPWNNYLEVVDEAGRPASPGVEGDILVTCLTNYAMPLLRYQIGDRGILAPRAEAASSQGQFLRRVTGRITDNLRTRDGRIVPGEYFIHLIGVVLNRGLIRKFQVVQQDYDRVVVKMVKDPRNSGELDTREIIEKIRMVMDPSCSVEVEMVEEIPAAASGKYRYTVSEVQ
jgi:phenylacetate-coenzyme A ligase PaaK-like adenylate-forming protein